jgi:tRNA threonylcarbamoyladenosine biosynthesis protein TsaB
MLLLGADTSGKHGSIALVYGSDDGTCEVVEMVFLDGSAFSAQLVPQIAALLSKNGFDKNAIDGFAVVSGPGSFTGLRVGLAAIKALAEALEKPIAAVSLLEAIAVAKGGQGDVLAALDAGRQQVYVGEFNISSSGGIRLNERLLTHDEFVKRALGANVVTPDSEIAQIVRSAGAVVQIVDIPRADTIARLGWKRIRSGETVGPEELEVNYVRPDAETFTKSV